MVLHGESGATFRSLRTRNYRLYAMGMATSAIGTWMQFVAQDWLVLDLTRGSGSALGIASALQFVPTLVFGLSGGVIADRYPKRRVLLVTQTTMGLLALLLGALTTTGAVRIWHVYALAFALGLAKAVDNPTRQAFVVELVEPADRANAIALEGAAQSGGRVIGPAIAGALISIVGVGPVFIINALSFAAVIIVLKVLREHDLHPAALTLRAKGQLRAGLVYVRGRDDLILMFVLIAFVAMFGINPQITIALMTKNVFHAGADAYGLASTLFAAGGLMGALLAARISSSATRSMMAAAFAFGVLETASALLPTYESFLSLLFPTGMAMVMFSTSAVISTQLGAAPEMRGRVGGLFVLIYSGTTPIGAPLIGWVAQTLGARAGLLLGGAVTAAAAMGVAPLLARQRRSADLARSAERRQHSTSR